MGKDIPSAWPQGFYSRTMLGHDLVAGLTVAAIAVPQAMAYALIAGIKPEYGLYTSIFPTIIASLLGSSSHLVYGPTNAISLVVFSAVAGINLGAEDPQPIQIVCLLTMLVGFIQVLIAVVRFGDLTRYVSESVILGFMTGAGILISLGQIPHLLGLGLRGTGQEHFLYRFWQTLTQDQAINPVALSLGLGTAVIVVGLRQMGRWLRFPIPDMLAALLLASLVVWGFDLASGHGLDDHVEVIGHIDPSLPWWPVLPPVYRGDWLRQLSVSASAIALLGLVESVAIGKSIAVQSRQPLDYNRQCLAEGLANLGGGLFQCMPGSGSLTRSAINYQAGARTRLAGLFTGAAVAGVVLLFAPLARYVPKPALAGILLVSVWRLIDRRRLIYCLSATRFDAGIALATAAAAVFIGIEYAILIGTFLSFLFFVPRAARLQTAELVVSPDRVIRERHLDDPQCTLMALFSVEGELFFGAAPELDDLFVELTRRVEGGTRLIVLRVKRARNPDMVCLERLQHFLEDMHGRNVTVLLCGVREDFAKALRNLRFHHWLSPECLFLEEAATGSSTLRAVRRAYELLGSERCPTCPRPREGEEDKGEWYYVI